MGSYKPYGVDGRTGRPVYVGDDEAEARRHDLERDLDHFRKNFHRLVGGASGSAQHGNHKAGGTKKRREAEAYYNLYYLGVRTPD